MTTATDRGPGILSVNNGRARNPRTGGFPQRPKRPPAPYTAPARIIFPPKTSCLQVFFEVSDSNRALRGFGLPWSWPAPRGVRRGFRGWREGLVRCAWNVGALDRWPRRRLWRARCVLPSASARLRRVVVVLAVVAGWVLAPAAGLCTFVRMSEQLQTNVRTVRIPAELCDRIDGARGGVPRERFVRELLEMALNAAPVVASSPIAPRAPSSSVARANVRPVPKGGK